MRLGNLGARLMEAATMASDQDPDQLEAGLAGAPTPVVRVRVSDDPSDAELIEVGRVVVHALQLRRDRGRDLGLIVVVRGGKPSLVLGANPEVELVAGELVDPPAAEPTCPECGSSDISLGSHSDPTAACANCGASV